MTSHTFTIRSIGIISTPWPTTAECPRNGRQPDPAPLCSVQVFPEYVEGLRSIEGFSHLILLYWMHLIRDPELVFVPPFDGQQRGIFSTRAPWRPNPIGLSVVGFEGFAAPDTLRLRYLDCVDGTQLIDIKPYLPTTDCEAGASMGWLERHATRRPTP